MPSIKAEVEDKHDRKITSRQMSFARYVVEGIYSNVECARKAGFKSDGCRTRFTFAQWERLSSRCWSTSMN